jgi:hypothetical protein
VREGRPIKEMLICEQVTGMELVVVPDVAVTDVVPGERQVRTPPGETTAMIAGEDCQFADEVTSVEVPFA